MRRAMESNLRSLAARTPFSANAHMDVVNDRFGGPFAANADPSNDGLSGSFRQSGYALDAIKTRVVAALAAIGTVNGNVTVETTHNVIADDVIAVGFSLTPNAATDTFRVGSAILVGSTEAPHRSGFRLTTHKPYVWDIAGDVVDDTSVRIGVSTPSAPTSSAGGLGIVASALATTSSTDASRDTNTPLGNAAREVAKGENPLSLSTAVKVGALVVGSLVCLALVGYAVRSFK